MRLTPDGTVYRVVRVNPCAAYLKATHADPVRVTIGERTFLAHEEGKLLAVSAHAAVYREGA